MFKKIIFCLKNLYYRTKFIKHNKNLFFNKKFKKINQIFLIEFNAFHDHHISYSVFSNYIKKKFNCEIYAFFNGCLLYSPLVFNFVNVFKWSIGNYFSLKNFGIYKSFGVKKIFRPEIDYSINLKAQKIFKKNFSRIKNKEDILKLRINNILIGDLLYDTYLKSKIIHTIDIKSQDFIKFYLDFTKLFLYWEDYFRKNNIVGVIVSHSVYSYAIPLRVALSKKVLVYLVNSRNVTKIKKSNFYGSPAGNYKNYKNLFRRLNQNTKNNLLKNAKIEVEKKLNGAIGPKVNMDHANISSFSNKKYRKIIKNSKKFKVLIATHDFFDAVHYYGDCIFPDFYEWLKFLLLISKKTNYEWYIKNHPKYSGKYKKYQYFTNLIVNNMIKEFNKNVTLIPNNTSNRQLISEGIGAVLTVYGSVASEFPYYGIPVINASKNNIYTNYSFSVTPNSKEHYIKIIKSLPKYGVAKSAKREIIEHYSLRFLIQDNNWLFDDFNKMHNSIGGYHNLQSFYIYKYWINFYKNDTLKNIYMKLDKFMKSNNMRLLKENYNIDV